MTLVNRCDRCRKEQVDTVSNRHQPSGWEKVCGVELCDTCSGQLHHWLVSPEPIAPPLHQLLPMGYAWDWDTLSLMLPNGKRVSREKLDQVGE